MSKILIQPSEHGLLQWFGQLTYRQKLYIFNYFRELKEDLKNDY